MPRFSNGKGRGARPCCCRSKNVQLNRSLHERRPHESIWNHGLFRPRDEGISAFRRVQEAFGNGEGGQAARFGRRQCGGARHEGVGHQAWRHAFRALVPAAYGHYVGKARFVYRPRWRWNGHREIFRQRAGARRARCVELSERRLACNFRGARLFGVGSNELCLYQRRSAVRSHGVLLVFGRGARQKDSASAFHGRHRRASKARVGAVRQKAPSYNGECGYRAGIFPYFRERLREAPRSHRVRAHVVRRAAVQGPRTRRTLFRRHSAYGEFIHEGARRRAVGLRRCREDQAQRGRALSA